MNQTIPDLEGLTKAKDRISSYVHRTPVLTSTRIDEIAGCQLYFKCDNFQKAGSYKIRGATNAILCLDENVRMRGVATHSSGNFAQAISLAAANLNVPAFIVMPENAPQVKKDAVASYGGRIYLSGNMVTDREDLLEDVIKETGATPIHPSNDLDVIYGQGTMTMELLEEVGHLDYVVCPIGGGGVGAGACLAAHHLSKTTKIIGAEPLNADDAYQSLQEGRIMPSVQPDTIADGLRTQLGDVNFPIIYQLIDRIVRVTEEEIVQAMRLVWERMKIIIEPSSATTLAVILQQAELFKGKHVGLIITGGNVSLDKLPF